MSEKSGVESTVTTEKPSTAPSFEDDPIRETAVDALACELVNRYTFMRACAEEGYPDAQTVHLRVGNQSFRINHFSETEAAAQWTMNMLAKALARIILEQCDAALAARPSVDVDVRDVDGNTDELLRLATFLMHNYPNEPGRTGVSESAVDVAVRLLAARTVAPKE